MRTLWRELRSGWRTLRRSPATLVGAALTLGIGVGAVSTLFTILYPSLRNPYSDRAVWIFETRPELGWKLVPTSPEKIEDWRQEQRVFQRVGGYYPWHFNVTVGETPRTVKGARVSPAWPAIAGLEPLMGRTFGPDDVGGDAEPVVLVSDLFWERHLGRAPSVVGSALRVDGVERTIVGVVPRRAGFLRELHELWIPDEEFLGVGSRFARYLNGVARLADGVSLRRAREDMDRVQRVLAERHPEAYAGWGVEVIGAREYRFGYFQVLLFLMFAGAGVVLLIGCTNVANLVLVRNAAREGELAVRTAFGATRASLLREHLFEGLILGALAAAVGLWITSRAVEALPQLLPESLRWVQHFVALTPPTVGFCVGLGLGVGAWVGLLPGLAISRADLALSLKRVSGTATLDPGGRRTRFLLAAVEVAVAFAVACGTAVLLHDYRTLASEDPGIRTDDLVAFTVRRPRPPWSEAESLRRFHPRLLESVRSLPEVEDAATVNFLPLEGVPWATSFTIDRDGSADPEVLEAQYRVVSPGYFELLGIPLVAGRTFAGGAPVESAVAGTGEAAEAEPSAEAEGPAEAEAVAAGAVAANGGFAGDDGCAVVVNAAARDRFWPGEEPVGATIRGLSEATRDAPCRVVGVVGNVRHFGLGSEPVPEVYYAFDERPFGWMTVVVRTREDPAALAPRLRQRVAAVDPDQAIEAPQRLEAVALDSVWLVRWGVAGMTAIGAVAIVLAATGAYGALRVWVLQRTREIAIRIALGARSAHVEWMIVRQGLGLVVVATLLGLPLAVLFEVATWWAPFLGVPSEEPPRLAIYGGALVLTFVLALVACLLPARRAARTHPADALRYQ